MTALFYNNSFLCFFEANYVIILLKPYTFFGLYNSCTGRKIQMRILWDSVFVLFPFCYIYKNPLGFSIKKTVFNVQLQRVDMYIELCESINFRIPKDSYVEFL